LQVVCKLEFLRTAGRAKGLCPGNPASGDPSADSTGLFWDGGGAWARVIDFAMVPDRPMCDR